MPTFYDKTEDELESLKGTLHSGYLPAIEAEQNYRELGAALAIAGSAWAATVLHQKKNGRPATGFDTPPTMPPTP